MRRLNIFIGAPAQAELDKAAVSGFMKEIGDKVILGGTAVSIFERETGAAAVVDLSTGADGVPPYGKIAGMTAAEGALTLKRLNCILNAEYQFDNAAAVLKNKILKSDEITIYKGNAVNEINSIDKKNIISEFINNLQSIGITAVTVKEL